MMEIIGLHVNSKRDSRFEAAASVLEHLTKRGKEVRLCGDEGFLSSELARRGSVAESHGYCGVDCVVVLGGDGTLLKAAKEAALYGTPVIGVNLGRLGYLTDCSANDYKESLDRLLSGEYRIEKRIMLEALTGDKTFLALNDVYVSRSGPPKLLTFRVEINGEHMGTYQADGILVSTPTGSTAYNLSAGGPIIKPDADILAITPVCPHALHIRSAVVSADDSVSVTVLSDTGGAMFMDGEEAASVDSGGAVLVKRAENRAAIIKTRYQSFYDILGEKM